MKNELVISNIIYEKLKGFGAIKWHKNKNHSFYIKFKDVRLGSIRIANHKGREKYNYTYELFVQDKDLDRKIHDVIESVKTKSKSISGFCGQRFIIWDKEKRQYTKVKDFKEYKESILSK